MKPGDKVKLKNPLSEFEKTAIFELTNINEVTGRVLITHVNGSLPIPATELVSFKDIELCELQ